MSDETLQFSPETKAILEAINGINKKLDTYDNHFEAIRKRLDTYDNQFEVIRSGLLQNSVSYDRLKAEVILLRADVKELTEEVRHHNKVIA